MDTLSCIALPVLSHPYKGPRLCILRGLLSKTLVACLDYPAEVHGYSSICSHMAKTWLANAGPFAKQQVMMTRCICLRQISAPMVQGVDVRMRVTVAQ